MKVPCHTCIVKAKCMHRIERVCYNQREVYYVFDELLEECDELKEYFGLNTPTNRVKIKGRNAKFYRRSLGSLITDDSAIKQFLRVMHIKEMPTTEYPVMRIKKKKVVIQSV